MDINLMIKAIIGKRLIKKAILLENKLYLTHNKDNIRKVFKRGDIRMYCAILNEAII